MVWTPKAISFKFSDFPPEIRNAIYDELLVVADNILLIEKPDQPPRIVRARSFSYQSLHPQILRANKTTYSEAGHKLYTSNHFEFPREIVSPYTTRSLTRLFITQIGSKAGLIRNIVITSPMVDRRLDHRSGIVAVELASATPESQAFRLIPRGGRAHSVLRIFFASPAGAMDCVLPSRVPWQE